MKKIQIALSWVLTVTSRDKNCVPLINFHPHKGWVRQCVDLYFFMVVRRPNVSFPNWHFRPSAKQEMDNILNAEMEISQNIGSMLDRFIFCNLVFFWLNGLWEALFSRWASV